MKELKNLLILVGDSLIGNEDILSFVPKSGYPYLLMKKLQLKGDVYVMQMGTGGTAISHNAPSYCGNSWIHQNARNIHAFNNLTTAYQNTYNVKITSNTKIATIFQFGTNDLMAWSIVKNNFVNDYANELNRFNDGQNFISLIPNVWDNSGLQNTVNNKIKEVAQTSDVNLIDHTNINDQKWFSDNYHLNLQGHEIQAQNAYSILKPYFFGSATPPIIPPIDNTQKIYELLNEIDILSLEIEELI